MSISRLAPGEWFGVVDRRMELDGLTLSIVRHEHAREIGLHEHARAYFAFLIAGQYEETHDGVTAVYEPFSIAFHPPGIVHWDRMGDGTALFAIELGEAWQARIGRHFDTSVWRLELQHGETVWLALRLLHDFLDDELDALDCDATVSEMLAVTLRMAGRDRARRPWVVEVKNHLLEHFTEPLALETLAERAGVHPASLARGFRIDEGTTIGEYVRRLRVQHACRLLADPRAQLADIAAACGFVDQSHLTRVFKSIAGMPPGAFREQRME